MISAAVALAFAASTAIAAPSLHATRTATPPVLDGRLDDAAWSAAAPTSAFTQKFPHEAAAPSERTTLRVLYDDEALYVAIDCEQRTAPLVAPMTRRDSFTESDEVSIALDTRGEGKTAFEFHVSASGVLGDGIRDDDDGFDTDWDEIWDARTERRGGGWSAEIVIPLRILRFDARNNPLWRFEARRIISGKQETDEWTYLSRSGGGEVSRYGLLTLGTVNPDSGLELRPFALGQVARREPGAALASGGTDAHFSAGLDAKWHVAPKLTLDATIRPDFAQVEADPVVLNLTNYEINLPEKRAFFLESKDLFATPMSIFYTRRIGRALALPTLPANEQATQVPSMATIEGGMKLTGQLGHGVSIGTLSALTGRDAIDVAYTDRAGTERRVLEPLSAYQVLTLRADPSPRTQVGLMATSVVHAEERDRYPLAEASTPAAPQILCPDGTVVPKTSSARCFRDAHVIAIDGRARSPGGDYLASGQVAASLIENGPPRPELDGTLIGSGDMGIGGIATLAKQGGEHWTGGVQVDGASKKLQYNDVGFMVRQAFGHAEAQLGYRELEPHGSLLEWGAWVDASERENLSGMPLARTVELGVTTRFANFWNVVASASYEPTYFDDREVGDGTTLERLAYFSPSLLVTTDPRLKLSGYLNVQYRALAGGSYVSAQSVVNYRPFAPLELGLAPQVLLSRGEWRYSGPALGNGDPTFGVLAAEDVSATAHISYALTPRLALQTYAQLFFAAGHYADVRDVSLTQGSGSIARLSAIEASPAGQAATNPDFVRAALNVNVVLSWEYRLGSFLYAVYSRAQSPNVLLQDGEQGHLRFDALGKAPASDVFLIKATYWWG